MFYLLHLFRSFQPLNNPIGFGASDFIEFALAAILVSLVLARRHLIAAAQRFATRTVWCMLFLAALPVFLRLLLLPRSPAPVATGADDASFLLLADTLSHFRLANPVHPFHRFFETTFALQQPSYSSIFPMGQGIALALGQTLTGHAWAGVLLSEAVFCALIYWMLRAWVAPVWALAGGTLAVLELGPLSYWMNSYWGGAVSGIAGCLVFGALPRLRREYRTRDAIFLGLGLGTQLLSRPYESIFLLLIVAVFLSPRPRLLWKAAPAVVLAVLPAIGLTLAENRAVTGYWTVLPYQVSRDQYGVPAAFTSQPDPVPHRDLTYEQKLDYQTQTQVHDIEARGGFLQRVAGRIRYARFFLFPALYAALLALILCLKQARFRWAIGSILVFTIGVTFYPYFYPHYIAAVACLFVLLAITTLERLPQRVAAPLLMLAAAHFIFWYGLHLYRDDQILTSMAPYESWDFINRGDPDGRIEVQKQLSQTPGNQLVFVRYGSFHTLNEWITNRADIDRARVVWALDLGPAENQMLRDFYPDRTAWLVEPDSLPPHLVRLR
jgi:hypothetical protein